VPQLPPGNDENLDLFDYLYVDRDRIGAYHTQLAGKGVPLKSTYTHRGTSSESEYLKHGIPKVVDKGFDSKVDVTQGTEHSFDPAWPMVLETIQTLDQRGYIRDSVIGVPVNSLIRATGILSIADLSLLTTLWNPLTRMLKEQSSKASHKPPVQSDLKSIGEFAKAITQPVAFQLISGHDASAMLLAWGAMRRDSIIASAQDLLLMHGGLLPGAYTIIGVLDVGLAGPQASTYLEQLQPTSTFEMTLKLQHVLRSTFGRPDNANGVTPLLIYRRLSDRSTPLVEPPTATVGEPE